MAKGIGKKKIYTYEFEHHEQEVVNNKGPFSAVSIGCDTKEDTPNRPEHEHQGNAPGDVGYGLVKSLGQVASSERHGEEIKRIPGLQETVSMQVRLFRCDTIRGSLVSHKPAAGRGIIETYPGEESNSEKGPMMGCQHRQEFEWIRKLGHRRLQAGEPAAQILGDGHAVMRRFIGKQSMTTGARGRAIVGGRLFVIRHVDVRLHTIQTAFRSVV